MRQYILKNRIKKYRKKIGYTQKELAKLVGVSQNAICSFEKEEYCPSAYVAAKLCLALVVPFEDLFYLEYREIARYEYPDDFISEVIEWRE